MQTHHNLLHFLINFPHYHPLHSHQMLINAVSGRKKIYPKKSARKRFVVFCVWVNEFPPKATVFALRFSFFSVTKFIYFFKFIYIMPNKILYYHRPSLPQMQIQFRWEYKKLNAFLISYIYHSLLNTFIWLICQNYQKYSIEKFNWLAEKCKMKILKVKIKSKVYFWHFEC